MRVRAVILGLACVGMLACAGLTEGAVELATGISIEEQPDGTVVIVNPDGTRQVVGKGAGQEPPPGFPLPRPPGDLDVESVLTSDGSGPTIVTWRLGADDDVDDVLAYYEAWFREQGVDVSRDDQSLAGMRTVVLAARVGDQTHSVTLTDALGSRLVTATVSP